MKIFTYIGWFLSSFIVIYCLWLGFFGFVGAFTKKRKYPNAAPQNIAVMICARNEEKVIGKLIDSLKQQNYPSDYFQIFTVAHNCTDHTAELAKMHGSTVFVRNNPSENNKIFALRYGLLEVRRLYPNRFFAYVVFDADSVADNQYLMEINNALMSGADVAAGFYDSKNFDKNIISKLAGTLYYSLMQCNSIPHNHFGLPVNVYGSGYGARMKTADYLDDIETLVDDFEFSIQTVLHGGKMVLAPYAVFYAEMPITLKEGLIQRMRWAMGDTQCFRKYHKELLRKLPKLKKSGFKIYMDLLMNLFITIAFIGAICVLINQIAMGISVIDFLFFMVKVGVYYSIFIFGAIFTLITNNKKIRNNMGTVILFPLWVFVSAITGFVSIFLKTVTWHPTARDSEDTKEDEE